MHSDLCFVVHCLVPELGVIYEYDLVPRLALINEDVLKDTDKLYIPYLRSGLFPDLALKRIAAVFAELDPAAVRPAEMIAFNGVNGFANQYAVTASE